MLQLQHYIPYLLNRAGSRIAVAFTGVCRRHGITLAQWRVLAVLLEEPDLRIGEVAQRTAIEASTLSRVIDGLEGKGLARRRRDADDARSVRLRLTPAGRKLTLRLLPIARRYQTVAITGFSPEEMALLRGFLVRLYDNMDRLEDDQGIGARPVG